MTSCGTDDVILGKIGDLTRTAKSVVNNIGFLSNFKENIYFSTGRCCIVFGKNRNSLSIQNGGPKFTKFAYFSNISRFFSDFKTKYIFIISMIV